MTIQDLRDGNMIIFEGIVGSQAYGTATATSDVDVKGVFIQPFSHVMKYGFIEQVSDEKHDTTFYEIGRFLDLLKTNNPTVLELLNLPEDCVLHKDPMFEKVLYFADKFVTKLCKNSFGGYAVQQIKKARGLNKKIVKPMAMERLGVLDFCYVPVGQGSVPLKEYLQSNGMKQEFCGLVSVPHMTHLFAVFYDKGSELACKGVSLGFCSLLKFKGVVSDPEKANDISLSSIPKDMEPVFLMSFNKDHYSIHCNEYNDHQKWLRDRNPARFNDNMLHGKGYDGKNLAHCHRLLDMSIEIGEGKGINIRRANREELLAIRRGEYEYDNLVKDAKEKIEKMNEVYEKSSLPEDVDEKFVYDLLGSIRTEWYKIKEGNT